jgi:hypothetical protein
VLCQVRTDRNGLPIIQTETRASGTSVANAYLAHDPSGLPECCAISGLIVAARHKNLPVVAILAVIAAIIALGPLVRKIVYAGR